MVGAQSFTEKISTVKELTSYEDKKKRKIILKSSVKHAITLPPGVPLDEVPGQIYFMMYS